MKQSSMLCDGARKVHLTCGDARKVLLRLWTSCGRGGVAVDSPVDNV